MSFTTNERAGMCDSFAGVGPDAPTMCEGWTTRDLLAHLLVRERRPDAAGGILIGALAKRTERVMASVAEAPYEEMIAQFRGGPPIWSPFALPVLGNKANLAEFFVHHEDILRAQPDWTVADRRNVGEAELGGLLKMMGRMLYRKSPVGVVLRSSGQPDIVAKKGTSSVTVVGEPTEIVLHGYGRTSDKLALVVTGDAADVAAFEASPRGI
jgi:uncharacterized protein (TIGR03085 family)